MSPAIFLLHNYWTRGLPQIVSLLISHAQSNIVINTFLSDIFVFFGIVIGKP